jgi:methylated-DNA-[protein]-cysteine S-methyltransferase
MKLMLHTPVGLLLVEYEPERLRSIRFWPAGAHPPAGTRDEAACDDRIGRRITVELEEYFRGDRRDFSLPLRPAPTAFQESVREVLRNIPYGEVRSYGQVADGVGRPRAGRAVGQANARNPLPIVVPCHRVVAARGRLGGYMGVWGEGDPLRVKEWLLRHERGERRGRSWNS